MTLPSDLVTQPFLCRLGDAQVRRTLKIAVRENASVLVEPNNEPDATELTGHILHRDQQSIVVILNANQGIQIRDLLDVECEVRLLLGEETYFFVTRVLEADDTGPLPAIRISWPTALYAEARRRFQRTRFAESSTVELAVLDVDPPISIVGKLCNVGARGAAILVDDAIDQRVHDGTGVRLEFQLPGLPETLVISGCAKGLTPAGTDGSTILRVEFNRDAPGTIPSTATRLEEYLDAYFGKKKFQERPT